jgi:peptidyl-prolyl cis-trans isomerase A (cyclophilin A)
MNRLLTATTILLAGLNTLSAAAQNPGEAKPAAAGLHPRVKMETSLGDIVLELDGEKAPVSTLNFIRYAQDKFYDGTIFHRVMKTFMIQGGGFTPEVDEKKEGVRPGIKNEWKNGLKNNKGTISMARLGGQPDSASAQFFINVVDNGRLDQAQPDGAGYAVFGKVVEGMETVDKIKDTAVKAHPKYPGGDVVPVETVVIKSVKVMGEFDKAKIEATIAASETSEKEAEAKAKAEQAGKLDAIVKKAEDESKSKVVKTESGLMYVDLKVGDGETPKPTDKVDVHYTGWLVDGTKFDSSVDRGTPFTFSLSGGVIKGWLEGVATMKVGGKRKLIIPSDLGYGKRGSPPKIPADATLVFDVELLGISKQ